MVNIARFICTFRFGRDEVANRRLFCYSSNGQAKPQ